MLERTHPPRPAARRLRGFSLVEMAVVVAGVAIVSALAYGGYALVVDRTHQGSGRQTLTSVMGAQETQWRTYGGFADAARLNETADAVAYTGGVAGEGVVSVAIDPAAPAVGLAVVDGGECVLGRMGDPDDRTVVDAFTTFADGDGECSGDAALTQLTGTP